MVSGTVSQENSMGGTCRFWSVVRYRVYVYILHTLGRQSDGEVRRGEGVTSVALT